MNSFEGLTPSFNNTDREKNFPTHLELIGAEEDIARRPLELQEISLAD